MIFGLIYLSLLHDKDLKLMVNDYDIMMTRTQGWVLPDP